MALLRYLKQKSDLSDDKGRLSKAMPLHLTRAANDSVSAELERRQTGKRGWYQKKLCRDEGHDCDIRESFPPQMRTTPRSAKVFPHESFALYGM